MSGMKGCQINRITVNFDPIHDDEWDVKKPSRSVHKINHWSQELVRQLEELREKCEKELLPAMKRGATDFFVSAERPQAFTMKGATFQTSPQSFRPLYFSLPEGSFTLAVKEGVLCITFNDGREFLISLISSYKK
ncbi:MAG: hypothetical protein HY391_00320 [Deltaproteobacteria bacterium]|nr:hypothetical protein [Deltaproteobacteria bacterium]